MLKLFTALKFLENLEFFAHFLGGKFWIDFFSRCLPFRGWRWSKHTSRMLCGTIMKQWVNGTAHKPPILVTKHREIPILGHYQVICGGFPLWLQMAKRWDVIRNERWRRIWDRNRLGKNGSIWGEKKGEYGNIWKELGKYGKIMKHEVGKKEEMEKWR